MKFKKTTIALLCFGLLFCLPVLEAGTLRGASRAIAEPSEPGPACYPPAYSDVDFRWAFAVMSTRDGKSVAGPVTPEMTLRSGDRLKMMIELQKRCFVYLFHDDGRNTIKLLFPYTLEQFARYYQPGSRYYVPRAEGWFKLDNTPGREKFYLVASSKRLDELEKAYSQYLAAVGDEKAAAGKALSGRIAELSKMRRELCSPAERPVTIGGALRSVKDSRDPARFDIAAFASEIVSKDFTSRTYTIEHQ